MKLYHFILLIFVTLFFKNNGMLTTYKEKITAKIHGLKKEYPLYTCNKFEVQANLVLGLTTVFNSTIFAWATGDKRWLLLCGIAPIYCRSAQIIAGKKHSNSSYRCMQNINTILCVTGVAAMLSCRKIPGQAAFFLISAFHSNNAYEIGFMHNLNRLKNGEK